MTRCSRLSRSSLRCGPGDRQERSPAVSRTPGIHLEHKVFMLTSAGNYESPCQGDDLMVWRQTVTVGQLHLLCEKTPEEASPSELESCAGKLCWHRIEMISSFLTRSGCFSSDVSSPQQFSNPSTSSPVHAIMAGRLFKLTLPPHSHDLDREAWRSCS